jgi:hypothetical protein
MAAAGRAALPGRWKAIGGDRRRLPRLCYSDGVVVPEGAVRARLRALEEVAAHLDELASLGAEGLRASVRDRWAAERGLELALAGVLEAGRGLLGEPDAVADEPAGLIERLARAGVLTAGLRARLGDLASDVGGRGRLHRPDPPQDPGHLADVLARAAREIADFEREARIWLAMELLPDEDEADPGEAARWAPKPAPEPPAAAGGSEGDRQEATAAVPDPAYAPGSGHEG